MEGKTINIITITFNAFDRKCQEIFYNKNIEECKFIIWKDFCNTAVLLHIKEEICLLTVSCTQDIYAEHLSELKYEPKTYEEFEKFKSMLEAGR